MSRVTELEKALTTLFRKGTEVGYTETEIDEFLENIDYHALLQAVWNKAETVYAYRDYARFCFETYGDLVDQWITFNEPIVPVEFGYFYDAHYPHKVDAAAAVKVAYHTQLASSLAVKACHEVDPSYRIGVVLNLTPAYPRSQHPADVKAARIAELFQAKSFLDPSVLGTYPPELVEILRERDLLPEVDPSDLELIKEHTVDFLGVNYYQPMRVSAPRYAPNPDSPMLVEQFYEIGRAHV